MEPPALVAGPAAPVRAAPGAPACLLLPQPTGTPPFTYLWSRGGVALDDRFRTSDDAGGVRLTVSAAQTGDSGVYTLQARNAAGSDTSKIRLEVAAEETPTGEDPPTFLRRLQDLTVKVGSRTRFLVEIVSSTECKVTWYRNERRLLEAERVSLARDGNFWCADVAAVSVDDAGRWTCTAENDGGRASCSAHLNVLVPKAYKRPEFVEELRALLTEQGTVSLECKVVGVPTPVLRWFKDSREIKAGDVFALTANAEDPTSLGTYTCEAVNCIGRAYSSSKVHVVGRASREGSTRPSSSGVTPEPPPIFTKELEDAHVKVCEHLSLGCHIVVPPWPRSVVWYNKEGKIDPGERYHVLEDGVGGYLLDIRAAEWADEGEWKCVATSAGGRVGISTCHVTMDVPKNYRKPRFMENLQAVLTEEGLVSFECKVVGFPTPVLSWFKDGQELKPGDVYQLTGTNSLGSYCCIARNCMGQASSSAELTVEDIQNQLNEEEKLQLFSKNQAPKFIQGLKSVEAKIDEPFRFTVKVAIPPEPSVLWYRDDQPVDESTRCHLDSEDKGLFNLDIQNLEFLDQAEWKCVAMNDFGHSVTSCFLKLVIPRHYKKPRFLENLQAILSDEGAVNLECKVIGVPQPVLKWYKDGEELKPGDIHRIISGQDGTCCLGTYTCEAQNCMGIAASSASLLGFDDSMKAKPKKTEEQPLQRNLSLSTIHEERTSQMYDTPVGDITLDDKGEISFSFDGKEVSVSLYETPDLTEEEALQIVEMYADQLSENVTEQNVVELPPLRFVKETSTSGNLLMEAIIIDVSPDYFAAPEEDLRTEADVEDLSIADENGPPQLSLDQDIDNGGENYLEKTMAGLLSDDKSDFPVKSSRKKSDSQRSVDDFFSLSRDQSLSEEKRDDDTHISESELQSFASARSSTKVKSKSSKRSGEEGQESSEPTKTTLIKEDTANTKENLKQLDQELEVLVVKPKRERRSSRGSRRSSTSSEKSISKSKEELLRIQTEVEQAPSKLPMSEEDFKNIMSNISTSLTKVINDVQLIERDIILKSELMSSAATASRSLEIISSVITPLSDIHSIANAANESLSESKEVTTTIFNSIPQPLKALQQSLTIIEKCIDMESDNKTLVKKTCVAVIETCGAEMQQVISDITTVAAKDYIKIDEKIVKNINSLANEMTTVLKFSTETIKARNLLTEANEIQPEEPTLQIKHLRATQKAVFELKSPLNTILRIVESAESGKLIDLTSIKNSEVIMNDMSASIQDLQTALEQIESLSVNESSSSLQKYNTEIIEAVMDSVLKLRGAFEQLSMEPKTEEGKAVLEESLSILKDNLTEISNKIENVDNNIGKYDVLQSDNKLDVLQKMAQILIALENNIPRLETIPEVKPHMDTFHKNLTKVLEKVIESNDADKYLTMIEICDTVNIVNSSIKSLEPANVLPMASLSNSLEIIQANFVKNIFESELNCSIVNNISDLLVGIQEAINQTEEISLRFDSEYIQDFSTQEINAARVNIILEHIDRTIASVNTITTIESTQELKSVLTPVLQNVRPILEELRRNVAAVRPSGLAKDEIVSEILEESLVKAIATPLCELNQNIIVLNQLIVENLDTIKDSTEVLTAIAEPLQELHTTLEIIQQDVISQYGEDLTPYEVSVNMASVVQNLQSCIVMVHEQAGVEVADEMSTLEDISGIKTSADALPSDRLILPSTEETAVEQSISPLIQKTAITATAQSLQMLNEHVMVLQTPEVIEALDTLSEVTDYSSLKSLAVGLGDLHTGIEGILHPVPIESSIDLDYLANVSKLAAIAEPMQELQQSLSVFDACNIPIYENILDLPAEKVHSVFQSLTEFKECLEQCMGAVFPAIEVANNTIEISSKVSTLREVCEQLKDIFETAKYAPSDVTLPLEVQSLEAVVDSLIDATNASTDIKIDQVKYITEELYLKVMEVGEDIIQFTAQSSEKISQEAKLIQLIGDVEANIAVLEQYDFIDLSRASDITTCASPQLAVEIDSESLDQIHDIVENAVNILQDSYQEIPIADLMIVEDFFKTCKNEFTILRCLISKATSHKKIIRLLQEFSSLQILVNDFTTKRLELRLSEDVNECLSNFLVHADDCLRGARTSMIKIIDSQSDTLIKIPVSQLEAIQQFKFVTESKTSTTIVNVVKILLDAVEVSKTLGNSLQDGILEELSQPNKIACPNDEELVLAQKMEELVEIIEGEPQSEYVDVLADRNVLQKLLTCLSKHHEYKDASGRGKSLIILKCLAECVNIVQVELSDKKITVNENTKKEGKENSLKEVLAEMLQPLQALQTQLINIREQVLTGTEEDSISIDITSTESIMQTMTELHKDIIQQIELEKSTVDNKDIALLMEVDKEIHTIQDSLHSIENVQVAQAVKEITKPIEEIEKSLHDVISIDKGVMEKGLPKDINSNIGSMESALGRFIDIEIDIAATSKLLDVDINESVQFAIQLKSLLNFSPEEPSPKVTEIKNEKVMKLTCSLKKLDWLNIESYLKGRDTVEIAMLRRVFQIVYQLVAELHNYKLENSITSEHHKEKKVELLHNIDQYIELIEIVEEISAIIKIKDVKETFDIARELKENIAASESIPPVEHSEEIAKEAEFKQASLALKLQKSLSALLIQVYDSAQELAPARGSEALQKIGQVTAQLQANLVAVTGLQIAVQAPAAIKHEAAIYTRELVVAEIQESSVSAQACEINNDLLKQQATVTDVDSNKRKEITHVLEEAKDVVKPQQGSSEDFNNIVPSQSIAEKNTSKSQTVDEVEDIQSKETPISICDSEIPVTIDVTTEITTEKLFVTQETEKSDNKVMSQSVQLAVTENVESDRKEILPIINEKKLQSQVQDNLMQHIDEYVSEDIIEVVDKLSAIANSKELQQSINIAKELRESIVTVTSTTEEITGEFKGLEERQVELTQVLLTALSVISQQSLENLHEQVPSLKKEAIAKITVISENLKTDLATVFSYQEEISQVAEKNKQALTKSVKVHYDDINVEEAQLVEKNEEVSDETTQMVFKNADLLPIASSSEVSSAVQTEELVEAVEIQKNMGPAPVNKAPIEVTQYYLDDGREVQSKPEVVVEQTLALINDEIKDAMPTQTAAAFVDVLEQSEGTLLETAEIIQLTSVEEGIYENNTITQEVNSFQTAKEAITDGTSVLTDEVSVVSEQLMTLEALTSGSLVGTEEKLASISSGIVTELNQIIADEDNVIVTAETAIVSEIVEQVGNTTLIENVAVVTDKGTEKATDVLSKATNTETFLQNINAFLSDKTLSTLNELPAPLTDNFAQAAKISKDLQENIVLLQTKSIDELQNAPLDKLMAEQGILVQKLQQPLSSLHSQLLQIVEVASPTIIKEVQSVAKVISELADNLAITLSTEAVIQRAEDMLGEATSDSNIKEINTEPQTQHETTIQTSENQNLLELEEFVDCSSEPTEKVDKYVSSGNLSLEKTDIDLNETTKPFDEFFDSPTLADQLPSTELVASIVSESTIMEDIKNVDHRNDTVEVASLGMTDSLSLAITDEVNVTEVTEMKKNISCSKEFVVTSELESTVLGVAEGSEINVVETVANQQSSIQQDVTTCHDVETVLLQDAIIIDNKSKLSIDQNGEENELIPSSNVLQEVVERANEVFSSDEAISEILLDNISLSTSSEKEEINTEVNKHEVGNKLSVNVEVNVTNERESFSPIIENKTRISETDLIVPVEEISHNKEVLLPENLSKQVNLEENDNRKELNLNDIIDEKRMIDVAEVLHEEGNNLVRHIEAFITDEVTEIINEISNITGSEAIKESLVVAKKLHESVMAIDYSATTEEATHTLENSLQEQAQLAQTLQDALSSLHTQALDSAAVIAPILAPEELQKISEIISHLQEDLAKATVSNLTESIVVDTDDEEVIEEQCSMTQLETLLQDVTAKIHFNTSDGTTEADAESLKDTLDEVQAVIIKLKRDYDGAADDTLNESLEDLECSVRSVQLQINEESPPELLTEACATLQLLVDNMNATQQVSQTTLVSQKTENILEKCSTETEETVQLLDIASKIDTKGTSNLTSIVCNLNSIRESLKSLRESFLVDTDTVIENGVKIVQCLDQMEDNIFSLEKEIDTAVNLPTASRDSIITAVHSVYGSISNMRSTVSSVQKRFLFENYGKPSEYLLHSIKNVAGICTYEDEVNRDSWKRLSKSVRKVLNHFEDIKFYINLDKTARLPNDAAFTKIILEELKDNIFSVLPRAMLIDQKVLKKVNNLLKIVEKNLVNIESYSSLEVRNKIPMFKDIATEMLTTTNLIKKHLEKVSGQVEQSTEEILTQERSTVEVQPLDSKQDLKKELVIKIKQDNQSVPIATALLESGFSKTASEMVVEQIVEQSLPSTSRLVKTEISLPEEKQSLQLELQTGSSSLGYMETILPETAITESDEAISLEIVRKQAFMQAIETDEQLIDGEKTQTEVTKMETTIKEEQDDGENSVQMEEVRGAEQLEPLTNTMTEEDVNKASTSKEQQEDTHKVKKCLEVDVIKTEMEKDEQEEKSHTLLEQKDDSVSIKKEIEDEKFEELRAHSVKENEEKTNENNLKLKQHDESCSFKVQEDEISSKNGERDETASAERTIHEYESTEKAQTEQFKIESNQKQDDYTLKEQKDDTTLLNKENETTKPEQQQEKEVADTAKTEKGEPELRQMQEEEKCLLEQNDVTEKEQQKKEAQLLLGRKDDAARLTKEKVDGKACSYEEETEKDRKQKDELESKHKQGDQAYLRKEQEDNAARSKIEKVLQDENEPRAKKENESTEKYQKEQSDVEIKEKEEPCAEQEDEIAKNIKDTDEAEFKKEQEKGLPNENDLIQKAQNEKNEAELLQRSLETGRSLQVQEELAVSLKEEIDENKNKAAENAQKENVEAESKLSHEDEALLLKKQEYNAARIEKEREEIELKQQLEKEQCFQDETDLVERSQKEKDDAESQQKQREESRLAQDQEDNATRHKKEVNEESRVKKEMDAAEKPQKEDNEIESRPEDEGRLLQEQEDNATRTENEKEEAKLKQQQEKEKRFQEEKDLAERAHKDKDHAELQRKQKEESCLAQNQEEEASCLKKEIDEKERAIQAKVEKDATEKAQNEQTVVLKQTQEDEARVIKEQEVNDACIEKEQEETELKQQLEKGKRLQEEKDLSEIAQKEKHHTDLQRKQNDKDQKDNAARIEKEKEDVKLKQQQEKEKCLHDEKDLAARAKKEKDGYELQRKQKEETLDAQEQEEENSRVKKEKDEEARNKQENCAAEQAQKEKAEADSKQTQEDKALLLKEQEDKVARIEKEKEEAELKQQLEKEKHLQEEKYVSEKAQKEMDDAELQRKQKEEARLVQEQEDDTSRIKKEKDEKARAKKDKKEKDAAEKTRKEKAEAELKLSQEDETCLLKEQENKAARIEKEKEEAELKQQLEKEKHLQEEKDLSQRAQKEKQDAELHHKQIEEARLVQEQEDEALRLKKEKDVKLRAKKAKKEKDTAEKAQKEMAQKEKAEAESKQRQEDEARLLKEQEGTRTEKEKEDAELKQQKEKRLQEEKDLSEKAQKEMDDTELQRKQKEETRLVQEQEDETSRIKKEKDAAEKTQKEKADDELKQTQEDEARLLKEQEDKVARIEREKEEAELKQRLEKEKHLQDEKELTEKAQKEKQDAELHRKQIEEARLVQEQEDEASRLKKKEDEKSRAKNAKKEKDVAEKAQKEKAEAESKQRQGDEARLLKELEDNATRIEKEKEDAELKQQQEKEKRLQEEKDLAARAQKEKDDAELQQKQLEESRLVQVQEDKASRLKKEKDENARAKKAKKEKDATEKAQKEKAEAESKQRQEDEARLLKEQEDKVARIEKEKQDAELHCKQIEEARLVQEQEDEASRLKKEKDEKSRAKNAKKERDAAEKAQKEKAEAESKQKQADEARLLKEQEDKAVNIEKEKEDAKLKQQQEKEKCLQEEKDLAARAQKEKDDAELQQKQLEESRLVQVQEDEASRLKKEKDEKARAKKAKKEKYAAEKAQKEKAEAESKQKQADEARLLKEQEDNAARIEKEKEDAELKQQQEKEKRLQEEKDLAARAQKEKDDTELQQKQLEESRLVQVQEDEASRLKKEKDEKARAKKAKKEKDAAEKAQKEKVEAISKQKQEDEARLLKEQEDNAARIEKEKEDAELKQQQEKEKCLQEEKDLAARAQKDKDDAELQRKQKEVARVAIEQEEEASRIKKERDEEERTKKESDAAEKAQKEKAEAELKHKQADNATLKDKKKKEAESNQKQKDGVLKDEEEKTARLKKEADDKAHTKESKTDKLNAEKATKEKDEAEFNQKLEKKVQEQKDEDTRLKKEKVKKTKKVLKQKQEEEEEHDANKEDQKLPKDAKIKFDKENKEKELRLQQENEANDQRFKLKDFSDKINETSQQEFLTDYSRHTNDIIRKNDFDEVTKTTSKQTERTESRDKKLDLTINYTQFRKENGDEYHKNKQELSHEQHYIREYQYEPSHSGHKLETRDKPRFVDHNHRDYTMEFARPSGYREKCFDLEKHSDSLPIHDLGRNAAIYRAQTMVLDAQLRSSAPPYPDTSRISESVDRRSEIKQRSKAVSEARSVTTDKRAGLSRDSKRKPVFSTYLTDRTAVEGSRVKLTCSVLSSSDPTVTWYKNGVLLDNKLKYRTKFIDGLITLEVLNAIPSDSAEYSCTVQNENGSVNSSANLKVYPSFEASPIPPTFTRSIRDTFHLAENELVLECRIRGQPLPTISWLKDDKSISTNSRFQAYYLADGVCRLAIESPTPEDSGKYTCKAENSVWSDQITHIVNFTGRESHLSPNIATIEKSRLNRQTLESRRPHFGNVLTDYKVVKGGTIGLQVEIKGAPTRVEWLREGASVTEVYRNAKTFVDKELYTLALSDVTEKESGMYTCRAWCAQGNVDMNAAITVVQHNELNEKPAIIVGRPEKDILISVGEDVNISFRVQGEPKPKVVFMKGIRDITNSQRVCKMTSDDYVMFTVKRSVLADAGTYCILARNAYGCDRAFVTVVVRQRASSDNLVSDWTYPTDDSTLSVDERKFKSVPERIPGEPRVVEGGNNWISLGWPKSEPGPIAPVLAYKVESWLLGKEGGARWVELGITPLNSFDTFNLKQGEEYHFRVTPRNRYGWGESVQTSSPIAVGLAGDRPEFTESLPGQFKVLVGETANLSCSIKGKPIPEVVWMKNGHEVDDEDTRISSSFNGFNCSLMIKDINIEDEARYSCEATNVHGRASTYARLAVVTDRSIWEADAKLKRERSADAEGDFPPQFTMRLRDRRVQVTYPVRLTCQVIGSPDPTVTWFKDGEQVVPNNRRSHFQDEHFHTLEIAPTTLEDGGVYEAMARNSSGAVSCRCSLVVDKGIRAYVAPEFCCGLEPLYRLSDGEELRISAVVEAYPSVGVTWYREGVRLRPSRRAIMTLDRDGQIELALAAVTSRDAGVYTCTASNEVGRATTSGKVEVIGDDVTRTPPVFISPDVPYSKEPMFIRKPRSSEAREGDTVIIECEVVGDPKPDVYWLRDFLKPDYYRDSSHFKRMGAGPEYRFEIPHAKLDYTGAYSVVARNQHGEAKAVISLQILAKDLACSDEAHNIRYGRVEVLPRFEKELTDLLSCDGDAVEFECRMTGHPEPDVRWLHYNEVIRDCPDFETSFEEGTARLKIKQVTADDEGSYTCEASNNLGKAKSSACLVVYPPGEPNTLSQRLRRPAAFLSAASTPRSTPRTTPARSVSRTPGPETRRLCSPARTQAPSFYTYPYNKVAEEGDTITLKCAIKGNPAPWATWDKDGVIITPSSRITIKEKDDLLRVLEIEQVTVEDVGVYRITIENELGRAEATARLEVITQKGKFYAGVRAVSPSPRKTLTYRNRRPSTPRQD